LNQSEAFILTSSAPGDATPQPLHIRTEPPLSIDDALHSVLIFTLFHYGALKRPKLPVTVHHADIIEAGALRGVLPSNSEGDVPFWL
jgi:argonaute-like protein implicated in RNA metabolism and viral defense